MPAASQLRLCQAFWLPVSNQCPPRIHAGLQSLDLSGNRFSRLPPVLAAATGLTELSLLANASLVMTAADVEMLLSLPRLRQLRLGVTQTLPRVLGQLFRGAPDLDITEAPMPTHRQLQHAD